MAIVIIIIEKNGTVKELNVRNLTKETIYKKCGFRKNEDFEQRHKWLIKMEECHEVEVWAKNTGKAGQENKYDLPPPIDNELYFGSIAIIALNKENEIINLDLEKWNKIYENLFGGFEDLDENEELSEDELKDYPKESITKAGYLKDGFVVEDENDEDSSSELEEEEYYYSE